MLDNYSFLDKIHIFAVTHMHIIKYLKILVVHFPCKLKLCRLINYHSLHVSALKIYIKSVKK